MRGRMVVTSAMLLVVGALPVQGLGPEAAEATPVHAADLQEKAANDVQSLEERGTQSEDGLISHVVGYTWRSAVLHGEQHARAEGAALAPPSTLSRTANGAGPVPDAVDSATAPLSAPTQAAVRAIVEASAPVLEPVHAIKAAVGKNYNDLDNEYEQRYYANCVKGLYDRWACAEKAQDSTEERLLEVASIGRLKSAANAYGRPNNEENNLSPAAIQDAEPLLQGLLAEQPQAHGPGPAMAPTTAVPHPQLETSSQAGTSWTDADTRHALAKASPFGVALLVAVAAAWLLHRSGLFALFSRFAPGSVLKNPLRKELLEQIRQSPGIAVVELCEHAPVTETAVIHHLRLLERHGHITSKVIGPRRLLFENHGMYGVREKWLHALLRNDNTKAVYDAIEARPGIVQKKICEQTGLSPSLVHWHTKRLIDAQLVQRHRDGRFIKYFAAQQPTQSKRPLPSRTGTLAVPDT